MPREIPSMLHRLLIAAGLGLLLPLGAVADGLERLQTFLSEVRTLESEFRQVLEDEGGQTLEASAGRVWLSRPDRFRWEYREPYLQEIVGDGERVWVFDADLAQVTVKAADEALGETPALLLSTDRPMEESFRVASATDEEGIEWVELRPLSGEGSFVWIRVGFEEGTLARMDLRDAFDQITRIHFLNPRMNQPLDETLFRFEPPEGVDVLGP
jgi:outer membrane lipoprotein carrier protein